VSRSGYTDEMDDSWALIRWRGAVESALSGKRGQALLREMAAALDGMPVKELVRGELEDGDSVCALGAVGRCRGLKMAEIDPEDYEQVAAKFGIAEALAREIEYENDEGGWNETPAARWQRMRAWVAENTGEPRP
jgi:hypothetical protein